jgi:hypothetical protein
MERKMKRTMLGIVCAVTMVMASVAPALGSSSPDPAVVAGDALVVRPLSFVATVIGSAVFVISLPVAATSGSIHSTADALILKPGRFTFQRPLGYFDYWFEYSEDHPAAKKARGAKALRLKAPKEERT